MSTEPDSPEKPREPLFRLDLGSNGGELAPYTPEELFDWLETETKFWSWVSSINAGSYKAALEAAINQLVNARAELRKKGAQAEAVSTAQSRIRSALIKSGLPHSSSQLGQEVEALRQISPVRAVAFLFPQLLTDQGHKFEGSSAPTEAWHGYVMGLFRRYGTPVGNEQLKGQQDAFDEMLRSSNSFLAERRAEFDQLQAALQDEHSTSREQTKAQASQFETFLAQVAHEHTEAATKHSAEMEALRRTFREEMTVRAPVEYWQSRQQHHSQQTALFLKLTSWGLLVLALLLGGMAAWAGRTSANPFLPDVWRLVLLAFVGAIGVWAVRLIVRILLSNMHLATDAAERVTMVKTYLALIEADKLPQDDDRKLILQALFRPGSDGMVKDEGLPHPALEFLTRASK